MGFQKSGAQNPRHKKALKQLQKAQRIRTVTQLALEGRTQPEIAAATGVALRTISRIIPAFRKECLEKAEENNAELVTLALARYNSIYQEAMAAWRQSQENKEVRTVEEAEGVEKTTVAPDGTKTIEKPRAKKTTRTEGQAGDSALLEKALKAQQAICELKGLNAPKQTELTVESDSLNITEIRFIQQQIIEDNEEFRRNIPIDSGGNGKPRSVCPNGEPGQMAVGASPSDLERPAG